jgi:hypothetical protein
MNILNNPHPIIKSNSKGDFDTASFDVIEKECSLDEVSGLWKGKITSCITDDKYILELIEENKAKYALIIESKPYFRKVFYGKTNSLECEFEFNNQEVGDEIHIKSLIIALSDFNYKNDNAEAPMNDYTFKIKKGNIIGEANAIKIKVEPSYQKGSESLIAMVKVNSSPEFKQGYKIRLDDDNQILIQFLEKDFKQMVKLYRHRAGRKLLQNLWNQVIYYTLNSVLEDPDTYKDKDWWEKLRTKHNIDIHNYADQERLMNLANKITKDPILNLNNFFEEHCNQS